ncbi:MAG: type II toxin-antitoxin system HicA family toxin [candidate division WOR-3 bacterium]
MTSKLKRLKGPEVIKVLKEFEFEVHSQRGSHIKLRRTGSTGEKQTLTIVTHKELDVGTLHAIFRQACRYIPEAKLRKYFYTE